MDSLSRSLTVLAVFLLTPLVACSSDDGGGSGGTGGGGGTAGSGASGSGGAATGGSGGASCKVLASECDACATTHCSSQGAACSADATCNSELNGSTQCICSAQTAGNPAELQSCMTTFEALDAAAKAFGECMTADCKTPCGL